MLGVRKARHRLMQQPTYLHHQPRTLLDKVVPMPRDGLQRLIDFTDGKCGKSVAFDRRMKDRFEIFVVGFLIGMQRLTVMVRRKRMHDSGVELRFAKRAVDWLVIDARHLDRHDRIG